MYEGGACSRTQSLELVDEVTKFVAVTLTCVSSVPQLPRGSLTRTFSRFLLVSVILIV